jgi:uncharacterized protein (DUF1330 family)
MKAYVIAEIEIKDPETYERYKALVPPSIAKYNGRYLVRGATTTALEGSWNPKRFVMLEFPSGEAARAWWSSPEYAPAKAVRQSCADTDMLLVEGPPFDPAAKPA